MTTTEAVQILTEYQRSGVLSINPLTIRAAIDKAIEVMQEVIKPGNAVRSAKKMELKLVKEKR